LFFSYSLSHHSSSSSLFPYTTLFRSIFRIIFCSSFIQCSFFYLSICTRIICSSLLYSSICPSFIRCSFLHFGNFSILTRCSFFYLSFCLSLIQCIFPRFRIYSSFIRYSILYVTFCTIFFHFSILRLSPILCLNDCLRFI